MPPVKLGVNPPLILTLQGRVSAAFAVLAVALCLLDVAADAAAIDGPVVVAAENARRLEFVQGGLRFLDGRAG